MPARGLAYLGLEKILKAYESKKEGKDQESIQTNTTTDKILKTNL